MVKSRSGAYFPRGTFASFLFPWLREWGNYNHQLFIRIERVQRVECVRGGYRKLMIMVELPLVDDVYLWYETYMVELLLCWLMMCSLWYETYMVVLLLCWLMMCTYNYGMKHM